MKKLNFLLIDDDPLSNRICQTLLQSAFGEVEIKTFTEPEKGLDYIARSYVNTAINDHEPILLLDINMPRMNGWELLEEYDKLEKERQRAFNIFILSSSVDQHDIVRAKENKHVIDFISKPVTRQILIDTISRVNFRSAEN